MCGLTGYARNPSGARREVLVKAFNTMLWRSEHRGKHATGVAIHQRRRDPVHIVKRAVPARTFLASELWGTWQPVMASASVQVVQGHVRYATHANAGLDEAAHPFVHHGVVGAHNGIITNWRDVEKDHEHTGLIVDSEAALVALGREADPSKALAQLEGYFALTWMKDGALYLARTDSAPLAAAYVPELCALLWHSEQKLLEGVLKQLDLEPKWCAELASDTIYKFLPSQFGAQASPTKSAFKHKVTVYGGGKKFNSARPSWRDNWDSVRAEERPPRKTSAAQYTLKDMWERMDEMADRIDDLEQQLADMEAFVFGEVVEEVEEDTSQLDLLAPPPAPAPSCTLCGFGAERGVLHDGVDGKHVHMSCVLPN